MNYIGLITLSLFLFLAVCFDCGFRRIPNFLVASGMLVAVLMSLAFEHTKGLQSSVLGILLGFSLFFPFYLFKGMAAGDVKLMAMVGGFLGSAAVFWAAAFSLIAGSVLGVLILLYKKQLFRLVQRYWAMANLRSYIPAGADDATRQRFPYAIAILLGTLTSILWQPFGQ